MDAFYGRTIFIVSDDVIDHMNAADYEYVTFSLNFTSNLRGGDNFVQIGLGLSTFYDDHVKENVERNMMAIRSAIILETARVRRWPIAGHAARRQVPDQTLPDARAGQRRRPQDRPDRHGPSES